MDDDDSADRQDRIMFVVGLGLIGFLLVVTVMDGRPNGFSVSSNLTTSLTVLVMFLLGGDVVRKRLG
jgi:hypothetical protein